MEIERRERDPDTGEMTPSEASLVGAGFGDVFGKIVAKLTGKTAKKLATKAAEKLVEKGAEKIGEKTTLAEQDEDAVLIQSINVEPFSRESMKATLKQDPVLSQVANWCETRKA